MQSQIAKGWGAGCLRWLGSYLLAVLIFLCASALAVPVILGAGAYVAGHFGADSAPLIIGGLMVLALLAAAGIGLAVGGWMFIQRQRQLDSVFSPLGLTGSALGLTRRQYHGTLHGRRMDVYYAPAAGDWRLFNPPAQLDIYLATPLKTSLAVVTRDAVIETAARLLQQTPLQVADTDFKE